MSSTRAPVSEALLLLSATRATVSSTHTHVSATRTPVCGAVAHVCDADALGRDADTRVCDADAPVCDADTCLPRGHICLRRGHAVCEADASGCDAGANACGAQKAYPRARRMRPCLRGRETFRPYMSCAWRMPPLGGGAAILGVTRKARARNARAPPRGLDSIVASRVRSFPRGPLIPYLDTLVWLAAVIFPPGVFGLVILSLMSRLSCLAAYSGARAALEGLGFLVDLHGLSRLLA